MEPEALRVVQEVWDSPAACSSDFAKADILSLRHSLTGVAGSPLPSFRPALLRDPKGGGGAHVGINH